MEMARSVFLLYVVILLYIGSSKTMVYAGETTTSGGDAITESGSDDNETTTSTLTTTTLPSAIYDTSVEVEIADKLTGGKMTFYCKFALSNESLWYKVIWQIADSVMTPLGPFNSDVREKSKLLETSLTETTAGFQIRCAYQVAYTEDGTYSSETTSPQKFVGIEILSTDVSVSDGGKSNITLQATAPIGCKSGETCSLGINIYNKDYSSSCYKPTTTFSECQVSVTQSTSQTQGKYCYAVCDPHMRTFEHDYYEHQYFGQYTLYENKEWKQEIQVKTEPCFSWRANGGPPYCICGLAIRAGKEVYIMDKCSPRRYWRIKYAQCDPTRSGLINVVRLGSQYSITLPSGTVVKTNLYTYFKFLNLYVYPSEGDVNNADGLCGRVGDPGFFHRNGTEEALYRWYGMYDYSESWSVKGDVLDLFSEDDRKNLDSIGNSIFQCKCAKDPSGQSQVVCDKVDSSDCTFYFGRARKVDDCKIKPSSLNRKKRSIQQAVKKTEQKNIQHTIVKRAAAADEYAGNWTEATATAYCDNLFTNSSAVQACKDVPGVDLESPKNNCIVDIKLEGSTSFALTAIETIKNKCFKEVGQNSSLQNSTDGSGSILDQIKNVACPFECSGHGSCQNGTCVCDADFDSDDCSIDLKEPPIGVVEYGDGEGECDLGSCTAISVSGGPFIEGGSAKCKVISKTLMPNGNITDKDSMTIDATIISIGEVSCPLPPSRRRKRAAGDPEMEEVTVYEVSVSNGGSYSESNLIIARHVDCHECDVNSTSVSCTYTGCYSEGQCYKKDQKLSRSDCFTCDIKNGEPIWIKSTADTNCTIYIEPATAEDNLLWVIGAVLGAVVLIVIIVIIVVVVIKKKNKRPITPILQGE
ncbi:hypothetical protein LOTGIDRAFT_236196 [Lottia gigantea]|uniref:Vwde helical domain-containing protein n=1 Tax=Lottia gigantea TaxID=225164 RepID=V3ZJV0_LOTGI|nr:hypothetical protein LOTGIDRAFT_236196 [Lottia gigantea]ESO84517.1 hypothetical protein LOTGIDRAFT_236196 [Lottia gigantea]